MILASQRIQERDFSSLIQTSINPTFKLSRKVKIIQTYGGGVVPTISYLLCLFDTTERSDVLVNTFGKYIYDEPSPVYTVPTMDAPPTLLTPKIRTF